jgi:adenylate cyclase
MTQTVIRHGGYLNRYLGDGILAIFGAPNPLPEDGARAAADAALEMLAALDELNHSELFPGVDAIHIGIGIHTGEAIVGNLGCAEKMDYSIIGDTVNLASRIESETKRYGTPILLSEDTMESLGPGYDAEFVDAVQVKGREQQVRLFRLAAKKGAEL